MSNTISNAGRFMIAPGTDNGACVHAGGRWIPKPRRRIARYPDHPDATVAAPTAYSSTRSQPMIHATSSPILAYEYAYALPATGIIATNAAQPNVAIAHADPDTTNYTASAGSPY